MSSVVSKVGPNRAGFVFGDSEETGPNKILGVTPVETFLVQYTDGASQKNVRLVFKPKGSDNLSILNEKIQGGFVATAATPWFNKGFAKKLEEDGITELKEVESV
jgi:hypothetical protein